MRVAWCESTECLVQCSAAVLGRCTSHDMSKATLEAAPEHLISGTADQASLCWLVLHVALTSGPIGPERC